MKSFRTVLEEIISTDKARVEKDIIELGEKIAAYKEGKIPEDKFRSLRLARGVYGQRQQGVQMIRIKLPYGRVTSNQLRRIALVSDEYSNGKLHITTRQDIQIHHVSLDRTPQLWSKLEKDDVTLREACGNTVRNVTASDTAGIDPDELFDVTPYAESVFQYFLRKPFSQELGRKIKIAFSSTDKDEAFTFIHDFGFIPGKKILANKEQKGFKVLIGGGLGAQPYLAQTAYDFLPETDLIPFIEASIRVFDRLGERNNRNKARLKYVIAKIGLTEFLKLVEEERFAVQYNPHEYELNNESVERNNSESFDLEQFILTQNDLEFKNWLKTNVFTQKQQGYFAVYIKVQLGNFNTDQARIISNLLDLENLPELRFTIDQNIQLRFVQGSQLSTIYSILKEIGLAENGYNSLGDITACPGTDTCNLGISNSTQTAIEIENLIREEYPNLLEETGIKVKISGCMNSCGQHGLAHIGFHGSSIKTENGTLPALQVLLGGGKSGFGDGRIAEKVIKLPSKRILDTIRFILNDYLVYHENDENFNSFYVRRGNTHFYNLLKPLADLSTIRTEEYIDWGNEEKFSTAIGIGECAGVIIDLVATLFYDTQEKLQLSLEAFNEDRFADSIYFTYSAGINAAKAKLIENKIRCNSHQNIIEEFDKNLSETIGLKNGFADLILQINKEKPSEFFAGQYHNEIKHFIQSIQSQHLNN